MQETGLKRGQPITFRIPSDTTDHTLRQLQKLKDVERRNFSSKIAKFVMDGVNDSFLSHNEVITIPLPKGLNKAQRDWLKHEQSEALLGSIVYQLMADPIRTASLFASLNGDTVEAEEAFYQKEAGSLEEYEMTASLEEGSGKETTFEVSTDDDLDHFDWTAIKETSPSTVEEEEEADPLGDFLAQMNK